MERLILLMQAPIPVVVQEKQVNEFDLWLGRIRDFGVPLIITMLVLYALYEGIKFLRKYGPKVAEGHVSLVESLKSTQASQASAIQRIAGSNERVEETLEKQAEGNARLIELNAGQLKSLATLDAASAIHMTSHQRTHKCLLLLAQARALETQHAEAVKKINEAISVVSRDLP